LSLHATETGGGTFAHKAGLVFFVFFYARTRASDNNTKSVPQRGKHQKDNEDSEDLAIFFTSIPSSLRSSSALSAEQLMV